MDLLSVAAQSILYGLISPSVFLPAIAIGLVARRWWQVIAAVFVLTAVLFGWSMSHMPEGASMAWAFAPIGIVAPLAWAAATFRLRDWMSQRRATGGSTLTRVIGLLLGLLIGAAGGGALGALVGSIWVDVFRVSNFEGGAGYLVLLVFVPIGVLIGAPVVAWFGWHLMRPKPAIQPR